MTTTTTAGRVEPDPGRHELTTLLVAPGDTYGCTCGSAAWVEPWPTITCRGTGAVLGTVDNSPDGPAWAQPELRATPSPDQGQTALAMLAEVPTGTDPISTRAQQLLAQHDAGTCTCPQGGDRVADPGCGYHLLAGVMPYNRGYVAVSQATQELGDRP